MVWVFTGVVPSCWSLLKSSWYTRMEFFHTMRMFFNFKSNKKKKNKQTDLTNCWWLKTYIDSIWALDFSPVHQIFCHDHSYLIQLFKVTFGVEQTNCVGFIIPATCKWCQFQATWRDVTVRTLEWESAKTGEFEGSLEGRAYTTFTQETRPPFDAKSCFLNLI